MTSATERLAKIAHRYASGQRAGVVSVCSAHPLVLEAALIHARERHADLLIEATCNQVNQDGGYTGMTPAAFRAAVEKLAERVSVSKNRLVFGGDHLGPNPWKHLPAEEAMAKADAMVAAYASAGFTKLHLDTSMGCAGEPAALDDAATAGRAARLAERVEAVVAERPDAPRPVYVIGTEVPVPGGATETLDHLQVTTPKAVFATVDVHRRAFEKRGLAEAFSRVVGVVVQPGVEFGNADLVVYDRAQAQTLSAALREIPQFVFEAHSTDYQPQQALTALVSDGFAILKVGPWLTFALREALYGLSAIADILDPNEAAESLPAIMERLMLAEPDHWRKYYFGKADEQRIKRHFSFSDRIRYYWLQEEAEQAVESLIRRLGDRPIPVPLISQYLAHLHDAAASGSVRSDARSLLLASVQRILDIYAAAISPSDSASP